MTKKRYTTTCPHTKVVKTERGDFVTEGKRQYFRVDEVITKTVPCGEKSFVVANEHPFADDSGLDPLGIEVKCKGCGNTYYLFDRRQVHSHRNTS